MGAIHAAPPAHASKVEAKLRDALRKAVMSDEFKPVMYLHADDYRKFILEQYVREKRLIEKLNLKEQIRNG
jgi:plasmid stability protein